MRAASSFGRKAGEMWVGNWGKTRREPGNRCAAVRFGDFWYRCTAQVAVRTHQSQPNLLGVAVMPLRFREQKTARREGPVKDAIHPPVPRDVKAGTAAHRRPAPPVVVPSEEGAAAATRAFDEAQRRETTTPEDTSRTGEH